MNSQHLTEMVEGKIIPEWVAHRLDKLSSESLKEQAADQLKPTLEKAVKGLCDELEHPEQTNPPNPPLIKGGEGGFSLPQTPKGRVGQALNSMEKYAAWDLLSDVEEWMSVKVPPYRYARKVFSWACTAFSVETVLAVLISLAMLYAGYLGVSKGVMWAYHKASSYEQNSLPIAPGNGGGPGQRDIQSGGKPGGSAKGNPITGNHSPTVRVSRSSGSSAAPAPKPSYISALTQQLIRNADGTIASVVPYHAVGQGLIAAKNAAIAANGNIASPPTPLPKGEGGRRPGEAAVIPAVTHVQADVVSPAEIHVSWDYLGPGFTYNAYTDVAYEMKTPWKENSKPIHTPSATWNPERGLDFYWLVIRAVDRHGNEGPMSEPIYVKVK